MKKHPRNCSCGRCRDRRNLSQDLRIVGTDMRRALAKYKGEPLPQYPKNQWLEDRLENIHPWLKKSMEYSKQKKGWQAFGFSIMYGIFSIFDAMKSFQIYQIPKKRP